MKGWMGFVAVLLFSFITQSCGSGHSMSNTTAHGAKTVTLRIPNHPLRSEKDLDVLISQIGDARIVLLGDATHGTSEFYTWRAALSKRLIAEKGFDFIAVEGEWADSYRVNNFIKGAQQDSTASVKVLQQFNRWPTWMWSNSEIASLVTWMNRYNQRRADSAKAGFFGLDVYCLWESMTELMPYLKDPEVARTAQRAHQCFQPFSADAQQYALAVASASANCRKETNKLWQSVQKITSTNPGSERSFVMQQNALVALDGERYFRAMVENNTESWNIRDRHMAETLKRLLQLHGPRSKAIVWEHNTHIGDARYTDMAKNGEVNVGQLVRKEYGENQVFAVGFGTYRGTVIAADRWGDSLKRMDVPPAAEGSWEAILHQLSAADKIILSKDIRGDKKLNKHIDNRAIGVVYNPQLEHLGNYVPSVIPRRYDAFVFIDHTTALHPLSTPVSKDPPDTYPWGY